MTPSTSGRTAMMCAGVRPSMSLASVPTATTRPVFSIDRDDGRLIDDDAVAAQIDEGIGRAEVDADVIAESAVDLLEEILHKGGKYVYPITDWRNGNRRATRAEQSSYDGNP